MKFVKNFEMAVDHQDRTSTKTKEDMWPIGTILGEYGHRFQDFPSTKDALAAARHLCDLNRKEHEYEAKPEFIDDKFPQFSKMWFVFSCGKETEASQIVSKKLNQNAPLKNAGQLESAKVFMEGLGFNKSIDDNDSTTQIEHERNAELQKLLEVVRLTYLI